jgi:hypothetical protein
MSTTTKKKTPEEKAAAYVAAEPTEVALSNPNASALALNMDSDLDDYAGAGYSPRPEENAIPFLNIIQKLSPQVEPKKPEYIKGAKTGMLFNSVTKQLFEADAEADGGLVAIQAASELCEVEWIPRAKGGGFVRKHAYDEAQHLRDKIMEVPNPEKPDSKARIRMLPNGNELKTTAYHYIILDTFEPIVVSLNSTGLKTHREWNSMYGRKKRLNPRTGQRQVLPCFQTLIKLKTRWRFNEQGDWYTIEIEDLGLVTQEHADLYAEAREFYNLFRQNKITVAVPEQDAENDASGPTINAVPDAAEMEIPF